HFVAIGIFDDPEFVLVGEEGDAGRVVARVVDPVRSVGTHHEADDVAGLERPFAVGGPNGWRSGHHDHPLLIAPVEVIGANRLPGRQVIHGHREARRSEASGELRGSSTESGRIALVAGCLIAKQVVRIHDSPYWASHWNQRMPIPVNTTM